MEVDYVILDICYCVCGWFVVGLVSIVLNKKSYSKNQDDTSKFWKLMYSDFMDVVPLYVTLISFIIVCVMTIFIGVQRISADSDEARHIECYKTLLYKAEMDDIRDELGLTNKEYVDEIQKWNMDVVRYKAYANNFWTGIFCPDWVNELQTIDLETFKIREKGGD